MSARPQVVPAVAVAALLLIALGQHPYGYYTFLRWAVCLAAVYVAWFAWARAALPPVTTPFAGIAILFNPLAPVYLERTTWRPIDVLCAVCFLAALGLHDRRERLLPGQDASGR